MPKEAYVRQKLYQAVDCLVSPAPLQERLEGAALYLMRLKPDDFVDEQSRVSFTGIMDTLTACEPRGNEGRIRATVAAMTDDQARAVAKEIYELDAHYRPLWLSTRGWSILDPPPPEGR